MTCYSSLCVSLEGECIDLELKDGPGLVLSLLVTISKQSFINFDKRLFLKSGSVIKTNHFFIVADRIWVDFIRQCRLSLSTCSKRD